MGFSHSAVSVGRGFLALFELFSSSFAPSLRSSLLPLMLSPSPTSESVQSYDKFAASSFGVCTLSRVLVTYGRTSGSSIGDSIGPLGVVSHVSCEAGGSVAGLGKCS